MSKTTPGPQAQKNARRAITIAVSLPTLFGSVIALCVGFVLVFSLGIIIGRGHNIEERIPELERIMPQRASNPPPVVIAEDEEPAATGNGKTHNGSIAGNGKIIEQGELAYRTNLKSGGSSRPAAETRKPPQESKPEPRQADKPAQSAETKPPQREQAPAAPQADTQQYNYSYQVAAYKDQPSCDSFAARLKKAGFNARTEKVAGEKTTWYKTMIDFTGKPDDTDILREDLKKHGIPRVILKSKVPAKRP